ncbi:MAG: AAA family ATPase [Sphaerochaetaceae bacterium]|nr:AAA family ATPase [Sphaerochaetaceae bacterium]
MRIAISGKSGCGNTTVTTLVSHMLGYPMVNFTFRNMAQERGIDFWEFCRMAEQDDSIDRELDSRQVSMAMERENCVLGSRLAIWMLDKADLKVYLTASSEERARRIHKREGGTFEERLDQTVKRDQHDSQRYKRIYGIDNENTSIADLVIETDGRTPEDIARMIVNEAVRRGAKEPA